MHRLQGFRKTDQFGVAWSTAIIICVVLCGVCVMTGCLGAQQQSPPPPNNESTEATPIPQTSAAGFPPLSEEDLKRLDERFPKRLREVLQNAKHIDVFELGECLFSPVASNSNSRAPSPIEKNKFQGCRISRRARVSDPEPRKELVEGILYSIGSGHGNACFTPRHAIRAVHNGERIELEICFECENFQGWPEQQEVKNFAGDIVVPWEKFSGGFSSATKPLFERILSKASSRRR